MFMVYDVLFGTTRSSFHPAESGCTSSVHKSEVEEGLGDGDREVKQREKSGAK